MKLEEAIKICDDFIDENKNRPIILHKAIKTVLQELEEATEERDMYLRQLNRVFDNGFISKKKIEDKIKELDENGYWEFLEQRDLDKTINILQELLER